MRVARLGTRVATAVAGLLTFSAAANALTVERKFENPCVYSPLEAFSDYRFKVTLTPKAAAGEALDTIEIREILPKGWVVKQSRVSGGGQVIPGSGDTPSEIRWGLAGALADCFSSAAPGMTPTPGALPTRTPTPRACTGLLPSLSYYLSPLPDTSGAHIFTGTFSYQTDAEVSGTNVSIGGLSMPSCFTALITQREIQSACEAGKDLSVKIKLGSVHPNLGTITRLDVVELLPLLWEPKEPNPSGFERDGALNWNLERRVPPEVPFPPEVTYKAVVPPGSTGRVLFGGDEDLKARVVVRPEAISIGSIAVPIDPINGTAVDCVGLPTPTPDPVPRCSPGRLPSACNAVLDACVEQRCRCVGDCDGNGTVTPEEIDTLRSMLGKYPSAIGRCRAGDQNGDFRIRTNEITKAVLNRGRNDCRTGDGQ